MSSRRSSGSRPKKNKGFFKKGHEYYGPKNKVRIVSDDNQEEEADVDLPVTPTTNPVQQKPSSSRSKLKLLNLYNVNSSDESECEDNENDDTRSTSKNQDSGYRIIDLDILKNQISKDLVCRHCHSTSHLIEIKRSGLGSVFQFQCDNKRCDKSKNFFSDQVVKVKDSGLMNHFINRPMALAMKFIGCGLSATHAFCGMMNLPPPVSKSSYNLIKDSMNKAVTDVQTHSMKKDAEIEYTLNENKGMYFFIHMILIINLRLRFHFPF